MSPNASEITATRPSVRHALTARVVRIGTLVALLFAAAVMPAFAQLARVGPVGFGGYPTWYQDKTGLTLDFCSPTNASELDGGWCLLLTGDTTAPEVFPSRFFDEHFYWAGNADASAQLPNGGKALLVLALEGAFAAGPVIPGDQIVFARIRIVINPLPASGTYTVYTPYGKYVFENQVAGDRLFFTEDIGLQCAPGDFACATKGKIGPFLLPSNSPGGSELPPVTASSTGLATAYPGTGKKYIADPARLGPVTGSSLDAFVSDVDGQTYDHNVFRVEGPNGFVLHTNDFALMGRVYEGAIGGQVKVDRASYQRSSSGIQVDVFATGVPSMQARIPGRSASVATAPQLQYFDAPCVANLDADGHLLSYGAPAGTARQMIGVGTKYWGQSRPSSLASEVCVVQTNARDINGNTTPAFFPGVLGDRISVISASYDSGTQQLTVSAESSDSLVAQTLTVDGLGTLPSGGRLVVPDMLAPPASIHLTSTGRGAADADVSTAPVSSGGGGSATVPVAVNDAFTVLEDSLPGSASNAVMNVLANDTTPAGSAVVTIVSAPQRGTAIVNADGTIAYTPDPNASGSDAFTYSVTVSGATSNTASVGVTITPVNDAPVAVNDSFNAVVNVPITLAVLANDTDPDGPLVPGAAIVATLPSGMTLTPDGTAVSFNPTAAGTFSFTYRVRDTAGTLSASATATVRVVAAETVTVSLAEFRRDKARLRISGTVSPVTNPPQTLTVRWLNGSDTVTVVFTPQADIAGNWSLDISSATGIQNPTLWGATQVVVTGPANGQGTRQITLR